MHTAILANGLFPSNARVLTLLHAEKRVICCDGAYEMAVAHSLAVHAIVGDGDSLPAGLRDAAAGMLHIEEEQETNDLAKAYRFAVRKGAAKIRIYGAAGLREDHFLGNLFHLVDFETPAVHCLFYTDEGTFFAVLPGSSAEFPCTPGTPVSVFAPFQGTRISSDGLKWKLDGLDFPNLWCGTLNVATADAVRLAPTKPIIVFTREILP
ncbi:MAG: thiamine diphosphokinase [Kiritimatiellae bacterium]|nr:thiamine diphosphokinase [Kiritimatiellia bacterium]